MTTHPSLPLISVLLNISPRSSLDFSINNFLSFTEKMAITVFVQFAHHSLPVLYSNRVSYFPY